MVTACPNPLVGGQINQEASKAKRRGQSGDNLNLPTYVRAEVFTLHRGLAGDGLTQRKETLPARLSRAVMGQPMSMSLPAATPRSKDQVSKQCLDPVILTSGPGGPTGPGGPCQTEMLREHLQEQQELNVLPCNAEAGKVAWLSTSQLVGANPSGALTYWAAFRTPVALCSFDATGTSSWVLEMKQKENSQSLFYPVERYAQCPLEQTLVLSESTQHHVEIISTLGLTAGGLLTISCRISSEHLVRALLAIRYCTAAKSSCRLTKSDGL